MFWWSASITLDNNYAVLTDLEAYFSLDTLPHTSVSLTRCISIVFSVLNILTHMTIIVTRVRSLSPEPRLTVPCRVVFDTL